MFELKNAIEWLTIFVARPVARGWMIVAFMCIIFGLGANAVVVNQQHSQSVRLRHDEHIGCVIQQRGLPEGAQASTIFHDIDQLVVLPQTAASKKLTLKLIPLKEYLHQQAIIAELHKTLTQYHKTVSSEPVTRNCGI